MLNEYCYSEGGGHDITDILSGGEYIDGEPANRIYWDMWEDAVQKILDGHPPLEKNWID